MTPNPIPTITSASITTATCQHCGAQTVQVMGGTGSTAGACLQCIADGGTCCSLAPLNRWKT